MRQPQSLNTSSPRILRVARMTNTARNSPAVAVIWMKLV